MIQHRAKKKKKEKNTDSTFIEGDEMEWKECTVSHFTGPVSTCFETCRVEYCHRCTVVNVNTKVFVLSLILTF